MRRPRPSARALIPLAILGVGALGAGLLVVTREPPEQRRVSTTAPLVRVVEARPQDWRYVVRTQGTVVPRTQSALIPQVSGEVVWVSPNLVSGGFFQRDEPLLRIDPHDYELELQSARAAVARSQSEFDRARTELARQRKLEAQGAASAARIDDAENADRVTEAALREAQARLRRAERDLARTELRAPFDGRVRSENVDVGLVATAGRELATLYAVDWAEVRLPIPDRELRFLAIPLGARDATGDDGDGDGDGDGRFGPEVLLRAEFAGSPRAWSGRIVRTEGEIDARSRMVHVVARVEDPYGLRRRSDAVPLAVGLFVEAEIQGTDVSDVYILPRAALRPGDPMDPSAPDVVHVVDDENRLRIVPVEVLRSERESVVIGSGLRPGQRVSISPLQAAVDGMSVRAIAAEPSGEAAAADETAS